METSFPWNVALFNLINAPKAPNEIVVMMAKGLAIFSPWLVVVVFILMWVSGTVAGRRVLMIAGVALGFGLAANFSIALLIYVPRPFELGIGNSFLSHTLETSFPSDHATFLWSLGFGILLTGSLRRLGTGVVCLGLATAWARVYLGVHFPLDMAASFLISLFAAIAARTISEKLDGGFFQSVERINAILLRPFLRQRDNNNER